MRDSMMIFLEAFHRFFRRARTVESVRIDKPSGAVPPPANAVAELRARTLSAPTLHDVAERSPAIEPAVLAAYWSAALQYLNFEALAQTGAKAVAPLAVYSIAAAGAKAAMSSADMETPPSGTLTDVNVVVCLWEVDAKGGRRQRRHPLLNVPASMDQDGCLAPRTDAMPEFNARYGAPDIQPGCFAVADKERADAVLLALVDELAKDKTCSPGWHTWWSSFWQSLSRAAGIADELAPANEAELLARLSSMANEVNGKAATWALFAVVYPMSGSGAKAVSDVYDNIVATGADGPNGLFHRLCGAASGADIAGIGEQSHRSLHGHIDEYQGGLRALFPLDDTQRDAVRAILALEPGQLQAVNGPPGSGKTAMLRAVVGSKWVSAALRNEPCPIIVACGATNQSVTNVIEAFAKAPHPDATVPHAQRWIDHAPSYGAFMPSASFKNDPKNRADVGRIVCIEKVENPATAGFLYRYVERTNMLDPGLAGAAESIYLKRAQHALADRSLQSVEAVVRAVWTKLERCVAQSEACLDAACAGHPWAGAAECYLETHGSSWTVQRRQLARKLLLAGGVPAALQFIDISWRAEAFHWAARYWEGRFLLAQRERLLSRHPCNVEEALRRMCMLTPCLVSTLHTAPHFARIDRSVTDQSELRSHVYGVIDLLVLDEAGQALPELAGAVIALAKTAAVVGDLKQLAPITANARLAEIGIAHRAGALPALEAIVRSGRSVVSGSALAMARPVSAWREADDDGVTLRFHYRCKPSIIEYCNGLCYGRTLLPRTDEEAAFPEPALAWVNIDAQPVLLGGSQCNRPEANAIVEWIAERWAAWQAHPETAGKALQDVVAIVTPYRAQADYLSQQLQAVFDAARPSSALWPSSDDVRKVTIGTVHRLQGAERPIVCFSLVEGPEQMSGSFVDRDATLMNVAVSRAKSSFIIFANPRRLFPPAADMQHPGLAPVRQLGAHLSARAEARLLYPQKLVLIEAGGKLAAMRAILGKACSIIPTGGALWTLPLKGGVDIGAGFVPRPRVEPGAQAAIDEALRTLEQVDQLIFATDDDRMGEYIAWQARQLLGAGARGKTGARARLGAISPAQVRGAFAELQPLNENKVLAEAVREVADWLVTRRFSTLQGGRPDCAPGELATFAEQGMCTAAAAGTAQTVGRVQGAVLRILLQRARLTLASAHQYRITASVQIGERHYRGHVFGLADGRELTTQAAARQFVRKSAAHTLSALTAPRVITERCPVPLPGTVDILVRAWEFFRTAPLDAMGLLQQLYDGSWSDARAAPHDILEPLPAVDNVAGHPPLRPLDRSASPEQMRSVMKKPLHQVYSLVWDYYLAAQYGELTITSTSMEYRVTDLVGVRFESLHCAELPEKLLHVAFDRGTRQRAAANAGIERDRLALTRATPRYTAEPAVAWDIRPDQLLQEMSNSHIGRPSTYARALERLVARKLLQFPIADGPLRLTPDGMATALLLEQREPQLSSPGFSAQLLSRIEQIEHGTAGPREVLGDLMAQLAPDEDAAMIRPLIWNDLRELQSSMAKTSSGLHCGPMLTRGDGGTAVADHEP